jgi:hypothetical protein
MRTRWLAVLSVALLPTGPVAAAAAPPVTVAIRDTSLSPGVVQVGVRGKVTFANQGTRAHGVASTSGSFARFVLSSGQRKSVSFQVRRCERYKVDGQINGVVLVGGATSCSSR